MRSVLTGVLAAAVLGWSPLASAGEPLVVHFDGSVRIVGPSVREEAVLILDSESAIPLTNSEMDVERGGVRGLSFSVHFEGEVNGEDGEGILHLIGPNGVIAPDGLPDPSANGVDVDSFIGELGPFQGIGQWAVVNGDGNDVMNSLTVNIFVTDESGSLSTFTDVLGTIGVTGP